jgi:hypothetical protein
METKLKVTKRHAFGRIDLMPANKLALDFCELLEKPVLPKKAKDKLEEMGFIVEES